MTVKSVFYCVFKEDFRSRKLKLKTERQELLKDDLEKLILMIQLPGKGLTR